MKRLVPVLGVSAALVLSGMAGAAVFSGPGSAGRAPGGVVPAPLFQGGGSSDADDAGILGGPIERFHNAGACTLTSIGALPGNWTHGDYVAAVLALDPTREREAAQSDCGKPMVAVGHGAPPDHALGNREAHAPEGAGHGPPLSVPPSGS